MRARVATAFAFTTVTVLALSACSTDDTEARPASAPPAPSGTVATAHVSKAPLSPAALRERLLEASDLGTGYARGPERPARHDDVTVLGCPALRDLGGDAATGGSLDFPRRAKTSFTYNGNSDSEVSEELHSDTVRKLSAGTSRIFDAMTGCTRYQVLVGDTAIDVTTHKMAAPRLGDERWSQLLTFSAGGRDTMVQQNAVRSGSVLLVVSGSPALVDRHTRTALAKVTAAR